jgi:hypothetical protein
MSRADDPRGPPGRFVPIRPADHQDNAPIQRMGCDRNVTIFGHTVSIVENLHVMELGVFIFEHRLGVHERYAVLRLIDRRFVRIPLESMVVSHRRLDELLGSC